MNLIKTVAGGLLGLALLSTASAQTVVRISGAQAFGDAAHRAIKNVLAAGGSYTYAYTGTDINKAQQSIWTGSVGGTSVIIKTSWNGSTEGVRVVAKNVPVNFLVNGTTQSAGGTQLATTGNAVESIAPDAAAVDSFQSSTVYSTPTLVDKLVGAGAYVFVASKEAPANLTNITTQQAQALYNVGSLPLAVLTGSPADRTNTVPSTGQPAQVFATGRDYGSGARIVTFIETGIGANSDVQQYKPVIGTGADSGSVVSHALYPATTINGRTFPEGSDGNTSNGNLATVLTKTTLAGIGGYYISYLPTLDAANAVAGGAKMLAYNGVPYSPAAVAEGSYSLWAYEHLLYKSSLTASQKTVLDTLANQLTTTDATLLISTLKVSRPIDGGIITPNY